jgi:hypothetical protein
MTRISVTGKSKKVTRFFPELPDMEPHLRVRQTHSLTAILTRAEIRLRALLSLVTRKCPQQAMSFAIPEPRKAPLKAKSK